jgi:hypothetical protein
VPTGVDALAFIKTYSTEIGCAVEESDINNVYSRTQKTRNNTTKTKIVLEFTTLKKRKDYYFAGRNFRFHKNQKDRQQQQQRGGAYRFIKVVDAITPYKSSIFFSIAENRKIHREVIQNVWISDGEIFVRRFGKTASEPVKTLEFADLFPARRDNV